MDFIIIRAFVSESSYRQNFIPLPPLTIWSKQIGDLTKVTGLICFPTQVGRVAVKEVDTRKASTAA